MIKNYGNLISGYCGYLHCVDCVAKKRLHPFKKQDTIHVCRKCEEDLIKIKLWGSFKQTKLAKETEIDYKTQSLKRIEDQFEELNVEYGAMIKHQNLKFVDQTDDIKTEQDVEESLKRQIAEKKKVLDELHFKERENDKKLADLNNLLNELQKQIKGVKAKTKQLNEDNNLDIDFRIKTREHITDIVAAIRLKRHMNLEIKKKKTNLAEGQTRKRIVYKSRINSDIYDPNACSCRCLIF